jgi:hypothetical protein
MRKCAYLFGDLTPSDCALNMLLLEPGAEDILLSFSRKCAATRSQNATSLMSGAPLLLRAALKLDISSVEFAVLPHRRLASEYLSDLGYASECDLLRSMGKGRSCRE